MKRLAVLTGITGQDSALLANFLLNKNYDVVGVERRSASPNYWRLEELGIKQRITFASGDLTDQGSLDRIVNLYQPSEFYNLGANSFVGDSWGVPESVMNVNALGCLRCLEAIRKFKPDCRYYQASSSEMFGGPNRVEVLNERSRFYPRSPYGVSKLAAHWMTRNYRESFDLFTCCGILFNHEGPYRGLEFVTRKISDGVARIKLGLQNKIMLGNLESYRDWGDAADFVEAMWLMLQQKEPGDYVIGTGEAHSISDFVHIALESAGLESDFEKYIGVDPKFYRPADVGYLLADPTKAHRELGWKSKTSFERLVKKMVQKDIERLS